MRRRERERKWRVIGVEMAVEKKEEGRRKKMLYTIYDLKRTKKLNNVISFSTDPRKVVSPLINMWCRICQHPDLIFLLFIPFLSTKLR